MKALGRGKALLQSTARHPPGDMVRETGQDFTLDQE